MSFFVRNPIMQGADPHAIIVNDVVWLYPTHNNGKSVLFYAYSSFDLINWKRYGPILDFNDINWIDDDGVSEHWAWAPCLVEKCGKFYFYYSVGPQEYSPARIGVAVSNLPAGPFIDSGKPLLTGGDGFEAIDPMVFTDPNSGRYYLYAGGSAGATLRVFELNEDMISFAREITVDTPPKFVEGAFMHFYKGVYYLSYSSGRWRNSSYSVHYATSQTPVGPWDYSGPILVSNNKHKGPGHHSLICTSDNKWYVFYHRWIDKDRVGSDPCREIAVDMLEYDGEGRIKPVVMTDSVVKSKSTSKHIITESKRKSRVNIETTLLSKD